jgi:hypothetical protein
MINKEKTMFATKRSRTLIFIMLTLLILSSCQNNESAPATDGYPVEANEVVPTNTENDAAAYPPVPQPVLVVPESAYPLATPVVESAEDAYPAQTVETGILIQLDRPLSEGATTVSGVGPAGLPISIMNVTMMGEMLGSGVVGADGKFTISTVPLPANTRIGVYVDLAAIGLTDADVQAGSGAMNVPLVGYFVDTAMVSTP